MYVNFQYLKQHEDVIPASLVLPLIAIGQNRAEDLRDFLYENLSGAEIEHLEAVGFITYIKSGKASDTLGRMRLSDKGKSFLDNLETPEITEEDVKVFEWLKATYLKKGKEIGNAKQTKRYIALFRVHSGISKNALVKLCMDFLLDEERMKFSHQLEYVFFKRSHTFQAHFDINDSKLYQFYLSNKAFYDEEFKQEKYLR